MMKKNKPKIKETPGKVEFHIPEPNQGKYILRLYITGTTSRSIMALTNLKKICEEYLEGKYELEVIDLYKNPSLAKGDQIIAAPTLIKRLPLPFHRIIGDMSNKEKVLLGLDLREVKEK
jgi:circadian clock protein KaiB